MKTKLVYIITSSLDDIFWEEVWASAWSARYHNPDAHISLVCDKMTLDTAKNSYRQKSLELYNETVAIDFDEKITKKQRSRWLKTNLREYIRGDYLYIDSDTIITDSLKEIDGWNFDIGMVLNQHRLKSFSPQSIEYYEMAYGQALPVNVPYYNGGVIFAKDSEKAKAFYQQWHQNWCQLGEKINYTDQTPLARTVIENNNPVTEISGIYNSQVSVSARYLNSAKIVHFYHEWWHAYSAVFPFMNNTTYKRIKEKQGIDEDLQQMIINFDTEIRGKSIPFTDDMFSFFDSTMVRFVLLPLFFKKRKLYHSADKFVHRICQLMYRLHIKF